MGGVDAAIADLLITHGINLLRLTAGYQNSVLELLEQMERELVEKLTRPKPLTDISRQRLLDLLAECRSLIAQTYIEAKKVVSGGEIATLDAQHTQRAFSLVVADRLTVGIPSNLKTLAADTLIQGAPSSEWWSRQGADTAFRFANAVRQGVAQGETNAQIVARVRGTRTAPGIMETSRRNAEALVRTSVQTIANVSRLEVFKGNGDVLDGVRQLSTLDGRTSDTCIAYSGGEWDLEEKPIPPTRLPFNGGPPRHWNCRSVLTPMVKPIQGLEMPVGTRAAAGGPVRGDISFSDWLEGKTKAFQDDLLGDGKADLWRSGKITLTQLLDQRGRPLTLAQLRDRYAS